MTPLKKRRSRLISIELKRGRPERLVVTIYPCGTLGFRHPRCRKEYLLDLRSAYLLAATREADRLFASREAAGRARGQHRRAESPVAR